jgi:hypothetical protein
MLNLGVLAKRKTFFDRMVYAKCGEFWQSERRFLTRWFPKMSSHSECKGLVNLHPNA